MRFLHFFAENWANILLIVGGCLGLVVYILQERGKKREASTQIILQIDEIQENMRKISEYVTGGNLDLIAFCEVPFSMKTNYWNEYKHYFAQKMDAESYISLNLLYEYAAEVQEIRAVLKECQKNYLQTAQRAVTDMETQLIVSDLNTIYADAKMQGRVSSVNDVREQEIPEEDKNIICAIGPKVANQSQGLGFNQFSGIPNQQKNIVRDIINKSVLTPYVPAQMQMNLEKILRKCSMLEIKGTEGYRMLKKISKRKY